MAEAGEPGAGQCCVAKSRQTGRQPPAEPHSSTPSHRARYLPNKAAAAAGGAAIRAWKEKLCDRLFPRCLGWQIAQALRPGVSVDLDVLLVFDFHAFRLSLGCSLYLGCLGFLIKRHFNAGQYNVNQHLIYFYGIDCLTSGWKQKIATTFSCWGSFSLCSPWRWVTGTQADQWK